MYNVQDYSVLYYNDVICEGWHFTCMWKTFARPHQQSCICVRGILPSQQVYRLNSCVRIQVIKYQIGQGVGQVDSRMLGLGLGLFVIKYQIDQGVGQVDSRMISRIRNSLLSMNKYELSNTISMVYCVIIRDVSFPLITRFPLFFQQNI